MHHHRQFRVNPRHYEDYYLHQIGHGLPVFRGGRGQRGHGIGNILGGLFRSAVPLLKKGAKALGKEALRTGMAVAGDVLDGRSLKSSVKTRGLAASKRVARKAVSSVTASSNGNKKRKRQPTTTRNNRGNVGNRAPDIFD